MSFLKNIFGKKDEQKILTYSDFWNWFIANEKDFSKALKTGQNIESKFITKLSPKLEELREGYFFLAGMFLHKNRTSNIKLRNLRLLRRLLKNTAL